MNGIIKVTVASLFLNANVNSTLIDEVLYGTNIFITHDIEPFYKIKTFYNYEGFVLKKCVEVCESAIKSWDTFDKMLVMKSHADIQQNAKVQSPIIKTLTRGSLISISEVQVYDDYKKVHLISGEQGYVRQSALTEYIKPTTTLDMLDEEITRDNIVKNAFSYLGSQYRWGGKTTLGIDCSGLSFMSYLMEGIIIFRDAKIKSDFPIKKIDVGVIKKGDLIFFEGHVGIYIGKGEFIHSSFKNNGVQVSSLHQQNPNYDEGLSKSITSIGSIF